MSAPYMPLFIADYLADTAHLSAAEHGAYLMLVMNYWQREKALPADDRKLARIARMTDDEWEMARDTIAEFFEDDGYLWHHKRIEAELSVAKEKSAKAKVAARASVEARAPNAQRTLSERSTDADLLGKVRKEEVGGVSASEREPSESLKTRQAICEVYAKADALPPDTSRVVVWLERGYSHDEIVAAIAGVVKPGNAPSSLAYFDKPLERMRSIPNAPPRVAGSPSRGPPQHRKGSAGMSDALDRIFPDDPNNQAIPSSPVRLLSGAG